MENELGVNELTGLLDSNPNQVSGVQNLAVLLMLLLYFHGLEMQVYKSFCGS